VVVGHEPGSVVGKLTAAPDCGANGVVMSTFVLFIVIVCSAESCRSAAEADPFVVVTYPVIDAGAPTAVTAATVISGVQPGNSLGNDTPRISVFLHLPDPARRLRFVVHSKDSSRYSMGGCLPHRGTDNSTVGHTTAWHAFWVQSLVRYLPDINSHISWLDADCFNIPTNYTRNRGSECERLLTSTVMMSDAEAESESPSRLR
jgi:hypothetical protein